ncbi:MAG TPA: electron transfer flavoprotein subunit beta/FixA family protein [Dehalococcoidales bacterium]|nr:electron transfer flavoprotein subunit beta/FixA family protein [Dehalococcoidales bacterium]
MHIVCCIKQVPDTTQVKIDPVTNTLIRAGVASITNPYDLVGVEAAIKLKEKYGGKVSVITMGIPAAKVQLRECLSLGATQAVLISDRFLAGADTLATSLTLSSAILKLHADDPVQIVICGKQAIDGDTAQVGPGIATRLGFTQLTYVSEIISLDKEKGLITVRREIEGGSQVVEAKLPVLLTVELELGAPRYASLPGLVRAIREKIETWTAKEIETPPEIVGLKGSPTSVRTIFAPPPRKGGPVFESSSGLEKAVDSLLNELFEKESLLVQEIIKVDGKVEHAKEQ